MAEPERILRIRTVLNRTGLSRSALYRKVSDGSFPRQVKLGEHSAGWHESAINQWIADPEAYGRNYASKDTEKKDAALTQQMLQHSR